MAQLFSNNADTLLDATITAVATSITVSAGDGALFTSPTGGDFELVTLVEGTNIEIVKMTARTTDTLTVVRAQEGTTGFAFTAGATVSARTTAATLDALREARAGLLQDVTEKVHTMTGVDVDPANGNIQKRTLAANETFTFTNIAAGQRVQLIVIPGAFTFTHTNIAKWTDDGTAPTTIAAEHWIVVSNVDGTIVGTNLKGVS